LYFYLLEWVEHNLVYDFFYWKIMMEMKGKQLFLFDLSFRLIQCDLDMSWKVENAWILGKKRW
jgi:hypothetical protein